MHRELLSNSTVANTTVANVMDVKIQLNIHHIHQHICVLDLHQYAYCRISVVRQSRENQFENPVNTVLHVFCKSLLQEI